MRSEITDFYFWTHIIDNIINGIGQKLYLWQNLDIGDISVLVPILFL